MVNHIQDVEVEAFFSECRSFRYKLSITKSKARGSKTICVIMQNPSDADEEKADGTVKFLEELIFEKDYYEQFSQVNKIEIVNQFAYVQSSDFKGSDEKIGPENDTSVTESIERADIILVAWGRTNPYGERIEAINEIIKRNKSGKVLLEAIWHPSFVLRNGGFSNEKVKNKSYIKDYNI